MKSPDIILAVLAHQGVISAEQGIELSHLYHSKPTYDQPVPIDFASALDIVVPLFEEIDDDHSVHELLHGGHGAVIGACEDCGQPIDAHGNIVDADGDDGAMTDEEIDGAFALWYGMKALMKSVLN